MRAGQSDEAGLVPCHQQHRAERQGLDKPLRQALEHRVWISRHQGPALRHGDAIDPRQHPGTARPPMAAQCLRHHAADIARRRRRGAGVRSIPQVKHYQAAHSLAVPPGLHALRSDPQYAASAAVAADRAVHCHARRTPRVCRYFRGGVKMRGVVRWASVGVLFGSPWHFPGQRQGCAGRRWQDRVRPGGGAAGDRADQRADAAGEGPGGAANQTLQDRLIKEMRLHNISSIAAAQTFLPSFVRIWNERFAVAPRDATPVHRPWTKTADELDLMLARQEERTLSKALTFSYGGTKYCVKTSGPGTAMRGAKVLVRHLIDGRLHVTYKDRVLALTAFATYPVPDPAADEKTLDARLEAIIAAQKTAEAMISRRADGLKPGASDAPLRGFGA